MAEAVHVATHFRFEPGNEAESFLLLGHGRQLTLGQIRDLPGAAFRGVEVMTLSACNTAMGDSRGNGTEVEGFAVLAQREGAKAIIATLWMVADNSTQH